MILFHPKYLCSHLESDVRLIQKLTSWDQAQERPLRVAAQLFSEPGRHRPGLKAMGVESDQVQTSDFVLSKISIQSPQRLPMYAIRTHPDRVVPVNGNIQNYVPYYRQQVDRLSKLHATQARKMQVYMDIQAPDVTSQRMLFDANAHFGR